MESSYFLTRQACTCKLVDKHSSTLRDQYFTISGHTTTGIARERRKHELGWRYNMREVFKELALTFAPIKHLHLSKQLTTLGPLNFEASKGGDPRLGHTNNKGLQAYI